MSELRPAGPSAYSGVLDEPIKVKRRKRIKHPWLWLLGLILVASALLVARILLISFPAFDQVADKPNDGLYVLRGAFHLRSAPAGAEEKNGVLQAAFAEGLDFIVLIDEDIARAADLASDSPLTVVTGQELTTSAGMVAAIRAEPFPDDEELGKNVFDRVRARGGWSVILRPVSDADPWTAWDIFDYEAIEFFNAGHQLRGLTFLEAAGRWLAMMMGSPYSMIYLGRRSFEGLAHWDDGNRKGRIVGLCGLEAGEDDPEFLASVSTYLMVPEELGPYGPDAVEQALKQGHHFCALPFLGDPAGFRFGARQKENGKVLGLMGDEISYQPGIELIIDMHLSGDPGILTLHLYLDGQEIRMQSGTRMVFPVTSPGVYRAEAGVLFAELPWGQSERRFLYSNPIYVLK